MSQFTAINVFVEADGKQCAAFIDSAMAGMFMQMLAAYQSGQPQHTRLSLLPDSVAEHVIEARKAIKSHIDRAAQPSEQEPESKAARIGRESMREFFAAKAKQGEQA